MGELIDKVKGKIKQAAGNLSGDKSLKVEGKIEVAKGKCEGGGQTRRQAAAQK